MDWKAVVERNQVALLKVVSALLAMAGLDATFTSPLWTSKPVCTSAQSCRVGDTTAGGEGWGAAGDSGDPAERHSHERPVLPRHLRNAILRLLRPAESAARRLVIVAAKGMVVPPSALRAAAPVRGESHRCFAKGSSVAPVARWKRGKGRLAAEHRAHSLNVATGDAPGGKPSPARIALPLFDRLRPLGALRRRARDRPSICVPGWSRRVSLAVRPDPSPHDPIDATRLALRLASLAAALDDLPGQAIRFVRWQARRAQAQASRRPARLTPLRPGRAPGALRRPAHEVHEVLRDLHYFAREALAQPDTS